jgi:uncharacterized protein
MSDLRKAIDDFLAQRELAIVGVSRGGKKFGNGVVKELTGLGYRMMAVHPQADEVKGVDCYPSFRALPTQPGGVILVVRPGESAKVVREAWEAGIRRVWMQQGAASPEALAFCREHEMSVVSGQCILMFAEPVRSIHRFHRWIWRLLGLIPSAPRTT